MRSIVLALSLSFTCIANAETTIKFNSFAHHKVYGTFKIETEGQFKYDYNIYNVKSKQDYGVFIYSNGNCDQYSDLVSPSLQDETGVIAKVEQKSDALAFTGGSLMSSRHGGRFDTGSILFQLELKGKVLVLEEVKSGNSTGIAAACGVHP